MSQTKTIRIEQANNGMFYAKYNGGGQMPKGLTGLWTNYNDLQARINHYLKTRKPETAAQKAEAKKTTPAKKAPVKRTAAKKPTTKKED